MESAEDVLSRPGGDEPPGRPSKAVGDTIAASPALRALNRFNGTVYRIEAVFLAAAMSVMLGSTALVILSRYVREIGLGYFSDLAVGLIPWVGLLGAAAALYRGRHIGMSLLRDRFPVPVRRTAIVLSQLSIIAFLAVVVWAGMIQVGRQIDSGVTTSAMEFPRYLISLALPVGASLAILHQIVFLANAMARKEGEIGQ